MTQRLRVLLVGDPRRLRATREELDASGLEVAGSGPDLSEVRLDALPDVVVLDGVGMLADVTDAWQERPLPALVIIGHGVRPSDVGALGAPGWAIVPPDSTAAELAAAIAAAARGFAVQPLTGGSPDEEDEGDRAPLEALTARERTVLQLLAEGLPNRTIASRLGISEHTVKFHLSSIFGKLGVSSRTEAVRRGVRAGLVSL